MLVMAASLSETLPFSIVLISVLDLQPALYNALSVHSGVCFPRFLLRASPLVILRCLLLCPVRLDTAFDGLYQAEEHGQDHYNPERNPRNTMARIQP